ncbi:MAG: TonB-dependent receptor [Alphaproteobacteria bacterium]|nr:TonB-dependent receptor [Alphaproteobacteria bacterium]MDP6515258.1 TonB-dependent receptor [Alphaproteobacteria bacterium]
MRTLNTIEKALALNLDPLKYGTIAEIGAGQEVARLFFGAGAAAGTVAKTISAYDMQFSDAIYGLAPGGRYVARPRLESMLETEFRLVEERIRDSRPKESTFFAFADTVATQGYKKRSECHGWLGVRFQHSPSAAPDDIILHVRLLDATAFEQQQAVGILGVNLIYGAYFLAGDTPGLVRSLIDNIEDGRVEVDMIDFGGPIFDQVDKRLVALEMVQGGLSAAAMISPAGDSLLPADAFYKKHVLAMRGTFRLVLKTHLDMFDCGRRRFFGESDVDEADIVALAEIPLSDAMAYGQIDSNDILARIEQLNMLGFTVLLSSYRRFFELRQYINRYSRRKVRVVTSLADVLEIYSESTYTDLKGSILEALGKLFTEDTKLYVYPRLGPDDEIITLESLAVPEEVIHLFAHFRERELVVPLIDYAEDCLAFELSAVLQALQNGGNDWKAAVPPEVHQVIINRDLARSFVADPRQNTRSP